MDTLYITASCSIDGSSVLLNGEEILSGGYASPRECLTALYRRLGMDYPKFFKMDLLSMGGVLATEMLFAGKRPDPYRTALVFMNSASSLEKDREFQTTIGTEYFPSPSVFVYTLPNIMLGEISIRHKLYGENIFLVGERFDARAAVEYVCGAAAEGAADSALIGWADADEGKIDIKAVLAQRTGSTGVILNAENLEKLW